jgi:osmotically-inducible protein OsmY
MSTQPRLHRLMMALAVVATLGLTACASTSRTEGTGEYVDDTVVTTKVKAAILAEPTLKAAEINVETFKGRVQLSGFVGTADDIARAVAVARQVKGVTSVANDMRLK